MSSQRTEKRMQRRNMAQPDETRTFDNGRMEIVKLGGDAVLGRFRLEPGWSWSKSVKPIVKTDSCQMEHTGYVISGRMKVRMNDGSEQEFGPGDAMLVPPGHDAWVIGNEPFVGIDFTGAKSYATAK